MGSYLWIILVLVQVYGIYAQVQYPCPPFSPYRLPHTTSCSKFAQCMGGVAIVLECDEGLHFNAILNECTLPSLANCVHDHYPCPLFNDPDNLVYLTDTESCDRYYLCYNNQPHEFSCIDGLHWDSERNQCRLAEHVDCDLASVVCPPTGQMLVPSPVSCAYFYFCSNGQAYGSQCPEGTLFDTESNFCIRADDATCLGPRPTTPAPPPTTTTPTPPTPTTTTPMPTPPISTSTVPDSQEEFYRKKIHDWRQ